MLLLCGPRNRLHVYLLGRGHMCRVSQPHLPVTFGELRLLGQSASLLLESHNARVSSPECVDRFAKVSLSITSCRGYQTRVNMACISSAVKACHPQSPCEGLSGNCTRQHLFDVPLYHSRLIAPSRYGGDRITRESARDRTCNSKQLIYGTICAF